MRPFHKVAECAQLLLLLSYDRIGPCPMFNIIVYRQWKSFGIAVHFKYWTLSILFMVFDKISSIGYTITESHSHLLYGI